MSKLTTMAVVGMLAMALAGEPTPAPTVTFDENDVYEMQRYNERVKQERALRRDLERMQNWSDKDD